MKNLKSNISYPKLFSAERSFLLNGSTNRDAWICTKQLDEVTVEQITDCRIGKSSKQ